MAFNKQQEPATIYGPNLTLTKDEEALLRTALSSNSQRASTASLLGPRSGGRGRGEQMPNGTPHQQSRETIMDNADIYRSPDQDGQVSGLDGDTSPLGDFDLEDGSFEWDNNGELFGDLPNLSNGNGAEHHDKRKKSADDDDDGEEGNGKRRESDEKAARKPGRKPLTGEPTTKRKAQNRAAQRAFRERKERHLKDLETKVDELEKASESTNHENGQLRAQVERLNNEVKEYRKRLSMTAPGVGLSPPTANPVPYTTYNHSNPNNDFVFAFPKFGDLPGTNFMNNGSLARTSPPATTNPSVSHNSPSLPNLAGPSSSQNSPTTKSPLTPISPIGLQGMTPHLQDQYQSPTTDQNSNSLDELNGLFSPSILETAKRSNSMDYMFPKNTPPMSTAPNRSSNADSYRILANTPGFTQAMSSGSTGSPSASSTSHAGLDSSCGTTPEPCGESPGHHKKSDPLLNTINEEASHNINHTQAAYASSKSPANDINGIDWLAQQNGGQFDPVLFGDYRDPQDNIMNANLGDFFNDAFLSQDFPTPFNTSEIVASPQLVQHQPATPAKSDPIKQCEAAQHANDDPAVKPKQFLSCDQLWDRVQYSQKITSGEMDMDDLCSQLKSKAKCSGKGAVIDQADVDAILGPAPTDQKDFFSMFS